MSTVPTSVPSTTPSAHEEIVPVEGTATRVPAVSPWQQFLLATIEQAIILFGIYVLSLGPMYWTWIRAKHVDGNSVIAAIYQPLWVLGGLIDPFGEWLNWYVRFWNL